MNGDLPHEPAVDLPREDVVDAFLVREAAYDTVGHVQCAALGG